MNKISVYTILYYDLQFYKDIIKKIHDIVDEIIIIDGPYSYAVDTLKKFDLFYDENNKPRELDKIIKKYSKVKYKYVICDTEEEKRMIGYNMCSNDLVLLVDTDEFLNIDIHKLNAFINNQNKFVCCAKIYNMCDYNINFNKLVEKYILFKKNKISALEHLNYTWLIGCKQTEKNVDYMSNKEFGLIYHFTLNRNKKNNIIKFIFYVLLYRKNNNMLYELIDNYKNDELLSFLTVKEILNIFVHSNKNRINIPDDNENNELHLIEDNDDIIFLKKYNNSLDFGFENKMRCLINVPVFFRLNTMNKDYTLVFKNVENVDIIVHYLFLNNAPQKITNNYKNILNNEVKIQNDLLQVKYMYIEIICNKTCDDKCVFVIKNIC